MSIDEERHNLKRLKERLRNGLACDSFAIGEALIWLIEESESAKASEQTMEPRENDRAHSCKCDECREHDAKVYEQPVELIGGEAFYPEAAKAYHKWLKHAQDNPIIMANVGFETYLAGWQATEKKAPKMECENKVPKQPIPKDPLHQRIMEGVAEVNNRINQRAVESPDSDELWLETLLLSSYRLGMFPTDDDKEKAALVVKSILAHFERYTKRKSSQWDNSQKRENVDK